MSVSSLSQNTRISFRFLRTKVEVRPFTHLFGLRETENIKLNTIGFFLMGFTQSRACYHQRPGSQQAFTLPTNQLSRVLLLEHF